MMNARVEIYPGIFRAESTVSPGEYNDAFADALQSITVDDVLDELTDCADELQAAVAQDDAELIGTIFLRVRSAYASRLAERSLYERTFSPSTQDVAAAALLERAHAKASARRFNGEPITGFGAMA